MKAFALFALILSEAKDLTRGDGAHAGNCSFQVSNARFLAPLGLTRSRAIAEISRVRIMQGSHGREGSREAYRAVAGRNP